MASNASLLFILLLWALFLVSSYAQCQFDSCRECEENGCYWCGGCDVYCPAAEECPPEYCSPPPDTNVCNLTMIPQLESEFNCTLANQYSIEFGDGNDCHQTVLQRGAACIQAYLNYVCSSSCVSCGLKNRLPCQSSVCGPLVQECGSTIIKACDLHCSNNDSNCLPLVPATPYSADETSKQPNPTTAVLDTSSSASHNMETSGQ